MGILKLVPNETYLVILSLKVSITCILAFSGNFSAKMAWVYLSLVESFPQNSKWMMISVFLIRVALNQGKRRE